ncbi:MAG: hypothetical protein LKJ25_04405 [Clostridia bacterium]|nr:hypothetical protein [Clostridia bacterium]
MGTSNIFVKFTNGAEIIVSKVSDITLNQPNNCFCLIKNGRSIFIPANHVLYIGTEFDIKS